jgi:hypothetical protein
MNASVVYPYATQYTVKAGRNIYDQIVINGSNYTIIPVIPKNAINVNNTSSNVVDSQVQFNGFNFSKVLLDVLVIIVVFVGAIMIKKNERTGETEGIVPFIIILIFAAIAGIPQALNSDYSIMVIVLIGVIMVITTEFTGRIK